MTDAQKNANPASDATDLDRQGGSSTQGSDRGTTLDSARTGGRTGGMGGMPGTLNADTDMAGTAPTGELEDQ
ncbi:hypothetical protein [Deinococcus peraridilitoris]|uniref:Uncharacterized protein n=1 Tax=Deinococcus peraridilitoris (strain DSM 19664 / LMG 22246 / CIP 109416 / KR-200) TaxID=937777 RepID=K9ZYC3_DEIPD|nr:hypothetical protein [Deinococcus peraridilitoris]AFZ66189.1 hypothetical protein Deipe_0599 [Deinococcus peraridilitoris DSM 19664]